VGLTPDQVDALLAAAAAGSGPAAVRHPAVLPVLAALGLRVGELVGLDVTDVGAERGHRSIRFVGKGGKSRRRALTPAAAAAPAEYLAARGHPSHRPFFVPPPAARPGPGPPPATTAAPRAGTRPTGRCSSPPTPPASTGTPCSG